MQENANVLCYLGHLLCDIFTAALLCEEGGLCVCVCVCACLREGKLDTFYKGQHIQTHILPLAVSLSISPGARRRRSSMQAKRMGMIIGDFSRYMRHCTCGLRTYGHRYRKETDTDKTQNRRVE